MHPRLTVSAMSSMHWTLEEDLAYYDKAGIDRIGLSFMKLREAGIEAGARRVADTGIDVTYIEGFNMFGAFNLLDERQWPEQRENLLRAVDAARVTGANYLVMVTGSPGSLTWDEAADRFTAAIEPVIAAAADAPRITLENTNPLRNDLNFLLSIGDAVELAHRLDVGVCLEVNSSWYDRLLAPTIESEIDIIELVQVNDYLIGTLTASQRAVPGDGCIPLPRIIGQLVDAGYEGLFDIELVGPRIDEEGYASAIRRSIDYLTDLIDSILETRTESRA